MNLMPDSYVPSLRWRQAEYQALLRLSESAKRRVVPLIVVPKPEYDFEKKRMKKTVAEQVEPFAKQFHLKWGKRPAWIDVHPDIVLSRLPDGKLPLGHIFDALAMLKTVTVPVVQLGADAEIQAIGKSVIARDSRGVGLRVRLEDMMRPGADAVVSRMLQAMDVKPDQVDLIVDMVSPNYEPYDDFSHALMGAFANLGGVDQYRSLVLLGTAYPQSLGIDKPGGELKRHDWMFYEVFRGMAPAGSRIPIYGDYTIVPPSFAADIDFRKARPAGKLVYTFGGRWLIRKGGAFNANRAQMHDHCSHILDNGYFRGADFSDGDACIEQCAKRLVKPTSQTRWKEIGISHHIMHVLEDLAMPGASA